MPYNPNIHHRRSIRLKGYDYSRAGLYFITLCVQDRVCRFGEINNGEMMLNEYGKIAFDEWAKLPERFTNFELDIFQIMPNHIHSIIALNDTIVGAGFTPAQNTDKGQPDIWQPQGFAPTKDKGQPDKGQPNKGQPQGIAPTNDKGQPNKGQPQGIAPTISPTISPTIAPTIADIIGAYKSLVANESLKIFKSKNETMGKFWQRNYYEHIIRNEQSYQRISEYIINNPSKWNGDKFFTK